MVDSGKGDNKSGLEDRALVTRGRLSPPVESEAASRRGRAQAQFSTLTTLHQRGLYGLQSLATRKYK